MHFGINKKDAFTWIPKSLVIAMETMATAFSCHKRKPSIGFHVLKDAETSFSICMYEYPSPRLRRSLFLAALHKITELFDQEEGFNCYFHDTAHPEISFGGNICGYDVSVEVHLHGHKESKNIRPPLLYDLFTKKWTEREASSLDESHGDISITFLHWFSRQDTAVSLLLNDLLESLCCRAVLCKNSYDAFREHISKHEISDVKMKLIDEAGHQWKKSVASRSKVR